MTAIAVAPATPPATTVGRNPFALFVTAATIAAPPGRHPVAKGTAGGARRGRHSADEGRRLQDTSGHTHLGTTALTSPQTVVSLAYDGGALSGRLRSARPGTTLCSSTRT